LRDWRQLFARNPWPVGCARRHVLPIAASSKPRNRISRQPAAFSKVSVKSQTEIPREVRERLKLKPGDTLRYRVTDDGVLLDKATEAGDDPFAAFSEWTSEADEKASGGL
jgi:AbrB family looped-hinge helix DNA binding protein